MTREEAIAKLDDLRDEVYNEDSDGYSYAQAIDMAIESLSAEAVKRVDCSNFLLWLLDEIMDEENWELNAVADGEIIARKLKKLGLLEVKDGYYHRIFDENVWKQTEEEMLREQCQAFIDIVNHTKKGDNNEVD